MVEVEDESLFASIGSSSHLRGGYFNVALHHTAWMDENPEYSDEPRRLQQDVMAPMTVLMALILLFFVIGTCQIVRLWLCKCLCGRDLRTAAVGDNVDTADTVHDGRVFYLTGDQRRAVLEAIFSETSKVLYIRCLSLT
jgi:hypothetical protein